LAAAACIITIRSLLAISFTDFLFFSFVERMVPTGRTKTCVQEIKFGIAISIRVIE
jgi:hypothetical protein